MKKLVVLGALCALGLSGSGCASSADDSSDTEVDDSVAVAALEQGQDGSDMDSGDATDDAPALDRECRFSDIRKHLVATYDVDKDGKLSADERAELREDFGGPFRRAARRYAAREARRVILRDLYDSDDSGKLDGDEREAMKADLDSRCETRMGALIKKFDANGDGKLDDAEWTSAREELAMRFSAEKKKIIEAFDSNKDGKLDASERMAALLAVHDKIEARWQMLVAQFDADKDGKLNAGEQQALREAVQEKLRGDDKL
jgi:Ca2+-binding EF-hand superfamily protein